MKMIKIVLSPSHSLNVLLVGVVNNHTVLQMMLVPTSFHQFTFFAEKYFLWVMVKLNLFLPNSTPQNPQSANIHCKHY